MRALLLVPALLCGCNTTPEADPPMGDVRLAVAPTPADAGGRVTLTLSNGADESAAYNLCTSALQRRAGGAWEPVPEDRVCTMELRLLEPGAEATFTVDLPAGLPAGEYRYLTNVEMSAGGERMAVWSEPFRVEE